ncbi:ras-related protein RABB1b-like [Cucumis melo]|uniref:Ras-related protein RABB1b-like n=1 Tax=Cucumis melo TaxID=3656 RepID=A0ABM3KBU5_CUCME|nr:ras-related protein RABB1b-like [Cucumis melo]
MAIYDYLFKYILIGNTWVGKSYLMSQFLRKKFEPVHEVTVGAEFGVRTLTLHDKIIKLHIWDTAGQEAFKSITRSYYRGAIGALLVYDVTRRETFSNLKSWLDDVRELAHPDISIMVVGNKVDKNGRREVTKEEGQHFAEQNGLLFLETSAKTSQNVYEAFSIIANNILDKIELGVLDLSNKPSGIKVGLRPSVESSSMATESVGFTFNGKCCTIQ